MRASMRGSIRSVIVTDSELSVGPATAVSINRKSGLFSAQKPASASSLSKIGISSHLAIARMLLIRERQFRTSLAVIEWRRAWGQSSLFSPTQTEKSAGLTPTPRAVTVHQLQASDRVSVDRRSALRAQTDGHE